MIHIHTTSGNVVEADRAIIKVSGWVKYESGGEVHHIPEHRITNIHEPDPDVRYRDDNGDPTSYDSDIVYQSPHGGI